MKACSARSQCAPLELWQGVRRSRQGGGQLTRAKGQTARGVAQTCRLSDRGVEAGCRADERNSEKQQPPWPRSLSRASMLASCQSHTPDAPDRATLCLDGSSYPWFSFQIAGALRNPTTQAEVGLLPPLALGSCCHSTCHSVSRLPGYSASPWATHFVGKDHVLLIATNRLGMDGSIHLLRKMLSLSVHFVLVNKLQIASRKEFTIYHTVPQFSLDF